LTTAVVWIKIPNPKAQAAGRRIRSNRMSSTQMNLSQPQKSAQQQRKSMEQCKHPRVQIVAREEDSEFVECKECGEIFEASEFKDMTIEEQTPVEEP
jgi:hypothetical protein